LRNAGAAFASGGSTAGRSSARVGGGGALRSRGSLSRTRLARGLL